MTQPNNVEVDYLDTTGTPQTFVGNANTLQILSMGVLYTSTNANNEAIAEYLFPWSRVLRVVADPSAYQWGSL